MLNKLIEQYDHLFTKTFPNATKHKYYVTFFLFNRKKKKSMSLLCAYVAMCLACLFSKTYISAKTSPIYLSITFHYSYL